MLDRQQILRLIPHQGTSCLLDRVVSWSESGIVASAVSHLDANNPLRRHGRLGTICGAEYGSQAVALHGALLGGGSACRPGLLASLRDVVIATERLDDPAHGRLGVRADRVRWDGGCLVYEFVVSSVTGYPLVSGRAMVVLNDG